jgi:glycolate oxidase FAD binding subunit
MAKRAKYPEEAELAAMVGEAAARRCRLEIRGGGTKRMIGNLVEANERLRTATISGIAMYEPAALTVTVKAGTPLAALQRELAGGGQHLAFEPPDYRSLLGSRGRPTIGGVVACGLSGPRRVQAGACRDALIGIRFVDGTGQISKNGGRVMKNVTGYDLVKLLCGSYGTLGVLTEFSFKLLPIPETTATVVVGGLSDSQAVRAMSDALASPFDVTGAAHLQKNDEGQPETRIRVEGFENSVRYRCGRLLKLLSAYGDLRVEYAAAANKRWEHIRDVKSFAGREGAVWRIAVKPSDASALVAGLPPETNAEAIYDWGGGLVWLLVPETADCYAGTIRARIAMCGGHAMLLRASRKARGRVPVFHPQAPELETIAQKLRAEFDPAGILNQGRMTGTNAGITA